MSPLRARMIEDMKLAGLAPTTQEIYLQAVRSLAKHYHRSPELLAEGKRSGRGLAQAAARLASSGCQFQGRSSVMRRAG
jgi:hypothetical protein